MTSRAQYTPGAAYGAKVEKEGEKWTLVLTRDLPHPPAKVWTAITDPEHLREWAPFDSDRSLGTVGSATLTTVGAPKPHVTETKVTRADAPKLLEFNWGGQDIRWQLEPIAGNGTRLTLWHNIDRRYIAMGAVYPTTLKQMATAPQGAARLAAYARLLRGYPHVGIGGVDAARMPEVLATGVGSVAVVRALVADPDPEAAAARLMAIIAASSKS